MELQKNLDAVIGDGNARYSNIASRALKIPISAGFKHYSFNLSNNLLKFRVICLSPGKPIASVSTAHK